MHGENRVFELGNQQMGCGVSGNCRSILWDGWVGGLELQSGGNAK